MSTDWNTEITAQIIEQIEKGAGEWVMPWHKMASGPRAMPRNAVTGADYKGMNVFLLGMAGIAHATDNWASFKQWQDRGRQVAKGSKGSKIVFYKTLEIEDENAAPNDAGDKVRNIPMMRVYTVFNEDQLTDYQPTPLGWDVAGDDPILRQDNAETFIRKTSARVLHDKPAAYYDRASDYIGMPAPQAFIATPTSSATEAYYATLLHELTHWTGHKSREARDMGLTRGDRAYGFEELTAELGAAFLCRQLQITLTPRPDHAAYLSGWLKLLREDKRAIFRAAAAAQRAVDFLNALQATGAAAGAARAA